MAIYDPVLAGSPQFQGHSEVRFDRGLRISWGGIVAGTALGWAVFSLLSLLGAAIGLATFDPTPPTRRTASEPAPESSASSPSS